MSSGLRKSISVVIPNYNGRSLLEANLPSVFAALAASGVEHEVIVADDASTDDSVAYLEANHPNVTVVKSEQNGGFSTNINKGLRAATRELVFALNSDVRLTEDYFTPLLEYFDRPDTFGVMGSIMTEDGARLLDGAKYPAYSFGRIRSTLNYRLADGVARGDWLPTLFLSGANALIDREKLNRAGWFSELFSPFYGEDVELGIAPGGSAGGVTTSRKRSVTTPWGRPSRSFGRSGRCGSSPPGTGSS